MLNYKSLLFFSLLIYSDLLTGDSICSSELPDNQREKEGERRASLIRLDSSQNPPSRFSESAIKGLRVEQIRRSTRLDSSQNNGHVRNNSFQEFQRTGSAAQLGSPLLQGVIASLKQQDQLPLAPQLATPRGASQGGENQGSYALLPNLLPPTKNNEYFINYSPKNFGRIESPAQVSPLAGIGAPLRRDQSANQLSLNPLGVDNKNKSPQSFSQYFTLRSQNSEFSIQKKTLDQQADFGKMMLNILAQMERGLDNEAINYTTQRGGSADIKSSNNFVARLCKDGKHHEEAQNLFYVSENLRNKNLLSKEKLGFELYLPISLQLFSNPLAASPPSGSTFCSLSIMNKAKGECLTNYIKDRSNYRLSELQPVFSALGQNLATFQKRFMNTDEGKTYTAIHGDFHSGNILLNYRQDIQNYEFSLIDCGRMKLESQSLLIDPVYFVYKTGEYLKRLNLNNDELEGLIVPFYEGYLGNLQFDVVTFLKDKSSTWGAEAEREIRRVSGIEFFEHQSLDGKMLWVDLSSVNDRAVSKVFSKLHRSYCLALKAQANPLLREYRAA